MDKIIRLGFFGSPEFVTQVLTNIHQSELISFGQILESQLQFCQTLNLSPIYTELLSKLKKEFLPSVYDTHIKLSLAVSQPDSLNHGRRLSCPIAKKAKELGISLYQPEKINLDYKNWCQLANNIDICLVMAYGQILSSKILSSVKYGFYNWHPSLLPLYRGATPMQTAIYEGQNHTGLSWLNMTNKMDAGKIYLQIGYQLEEDTTFIDLAAQMQYFGVKTWAIALAMKVAGFQGISQDDKQATFCSMLNKNERLIEINQLSAKQIYNHFRAYIVFPGTTIIDQYFKGEIKLTNIHLIDVNLAQSLYLALSQDTDKVKTLYQDNTWWQVKIGNLRLTFIKCNQKNPNYLQNLTQSLLLIKTIKLSNGKDVDLRGFNF